MDADLQNVYTHVFLLKVGESPLPHVLTQARRYEICNFLLILYIKNVLTCVYSVTCVYSAPDTFTSGGHENGALQ